MYYFKYTGSNIVGHIDDTPIMLSSTERLIPERYYFATLEYGERAHYLTDIRPQTPRLRSFELYYTYPRLHVYYVVYRTGLWGSLHDHIIRCYLRISNRRRPLGMYRNLIRKMKDAHVFLSQNAVYKKLQLGRHTIITKSHQLLNHQLQTHLTLTIVPVQDLSHTLECKLYLQHDPNLVTHPIDNLYDIFPLIPATSKPNPNALFLTDAYLYSELVIQDPISILYSPLSMHVHIENVYTEYEPNSTLQVKLNLGVPSYPVPIKYIPVDSLPHRFYVLITSHGRIIGNLGIAYSYQQAIALYRRSYAPNITNWIPAIPANDIIELPNSLIYDEQRAQNLYHLITTYDEIISITKRYDSHSSYRNR